MIQKTIELQFVGNKSCCDAAKYRRSTVAPYINPAKSVQAGSGMGAEAMILIAVGANLPSRFGAPPATCRAAVAALADREFALLAVSNWYLSPADPPSEQPEYVNGVVAVSTRLSPAKVLDALHGIEAEFGRQRGIVNAARTLDLDLIDYNGLVQPGPPILPHPRLAERAFVLVPLSEIAPDWRDPRNGHSITLLVNRIKCQTLSRIRDEPQS